MFRSLSILGKRRHELGSVAGTDAAAVVKNLMLFLKTKQDKQKRAVEIANTDFEFLTLGETSYSQYKNWQTY